MIEAVKADAYEDIAAIARIAKALSIVGKQVNSDSYGPEPELPSLEELFAANRQVTERPSSEAPAPEGTRSLTRATVSPPMPRARKGASGEYPRFLRDGDRLVKVAWSKKERRPYEHRAPKAAAQKLLDAIRKRKGEGKQFEAGDVLPLMTPNGEEIPSYQAYLALSWLRHVGFVTKVGREGYVLRPGAATAERVDQFWESLPIAE